MSKEKICCEAYGEYCWVCEEDEQEAVFKNGEAEASDNVYTFDQSKRKTAHK